ncbi:Cytosine-specific methyltransferase [Mesorhizobium sp. ORS 3359]|nr:Cytosine-specific methyltransferase [Mesorhizobium sp. ORS 3359]
MKVADSKIAGPSPSVRRPVAVDLFAGAGGFSLGATLAGADIAAAIENNRYAAQSYRRNLVNQGQTRALLFEDDILKLDHQTFMTQVGLAPGDCDLMLGGPPCQGFSAHRLRDAGVGDPRNRLLLRYFEYVRALRPSFFLVENVPGLLWPRHRSFLEGFYSMAAAAGYGMLEPVILNARDYGVPQNRRRVFLLGYDERRVDAPVWPPEQTHVDPAVAVEDGRPPWLTASEVFAAPAAPDDPNDVHMNHGTALTTAFARTPHNGGSRAESGRLLACHRNHRGHFDVYGRIDPYRPGPTMTTACINPSKGRFVHPTENHGITLRQAARFQSFPEWFVFEGGLMAGGVQVGNAVPVQMARLLIEPLIEMSLAALGRTRQVAYSIK